MPQTEQSVPSVTPGRVQVAAVPGITRSVWPLAGISVCATTTSPHSTHFWPSVRPVSVQVGALPAIACVVPWVHSSRTTTTLAPLRLQEVVFWELSTQMPALSLIL